LGVFSFNFSVLEHVWHFLHLPLALDQENLYIRLKMPFATNFCWCPSLLFERDKRLITTDLVRLLPCFAMKLKICTIFCVLMYSVTCFAQDLYVATTDGNNLFFGQVNLNTCTFCSEMQIPLTVFPSGMVSLIALPGAGGLVAGIDGGGAVLVFDPPNTAPLVTIEAPPNVVFGGGELAPDGTVYIPATVTLPGGELETCIYRFNPVGNGLSELGCFPLNSWSLGDIYFWNGQLYAFAFDLQNGSAPTLININVGPVLSASVVQVLPSFFCGGNTTSIPGGPNAGIYGTNLASGCSGFTIVESDPGGNPGSTSCC
jgi:hypothetical protein